VGAAGGVALALAACVSTQANDDAGGGGGAPPPPAGGESTDGGATIADGAATDAGSLGDSSAPVVSLTGGPPCGSTATITTDPAAAGGPSTYLVDLGLVTAPVQLLRKGDRVVTVSTEQKWILWDAVARERVASGDGARVEIGGSLVAVHLPTGGTEVRALADGQLLFSSAATLHPEPSGAYFYANDGAALAAYSPAGVAYFSRSGAYATAAIHAYPGELRVAKGPAGADVIETVSVPTGTSTVSASFQGTFLRWFVDGGHFITTGSGIGRLYTKTAGLAEVVTPPLLGGLAGSGDWYWTQEGTGVQNLTLYRIGGGGAVVATYKFARAVSATPDVLGFLTITDGVAYDVGRVVMLDLTTNPPTPHTSVAKIDVWRTSQIGGVNDGSALVAVDTLSRWAAGNVWGAVYSNGTVADPNRSGALSCGQIQGVAASETGRVAVTTSAGTLLVYDLGTPTKLVGAFDVAGDQVHITRDGTILAIQAPQHEDHLRERTTRVLGLPAGNVIHEFANSGTNGRWIDLARDGSRLTRYTDLGTNGGTAEVTDLTGATMAFSGSVEMPPMLPPDGNAFVAGATMPGSPSSTTRFYSGTGALLNAVNGTVRTWVGNDRVLVSEWEIVSETPKYVRTAVYDRTGNFVKALAIPEIRAFTTQGLFHDQPAIGKVSDTTFYDARGGRLFDLDGNVLFDLRTLVLPPPNSSYGIASTVLGGNRVVWQNGTRLTVTSF